MNLTKVLLISACLCVMMRASGTQAEEARRLLVDEIPLNTPAASNIQIAAWQDKVPAMVKYRAEVRKSAPNSEIKSVIEFFSASVSKGDVKYTVSVPIFQCPAQSMLPNEHDCTARIIESRPGKAPRVVKEVTEFPVVSIRGSAGYDATSNTQTQAFTTISIDSRTRGISVNITDNGQTDDNVLSIPIN